MTAGILILLVVALSWTAIVQFNGNAISEKGTYSVGAILPLSGPAASMGEDAKLGAELAVKEINNAGGVDGMNLELIFQDGEAVPAKSLNSFNYLVEVKGVDKVLTFVSSVILSIKPVSEQKEVILLGSASHPAVTQDSNYVVRYSQTAAQEGDLFVDYANKNGFNKIGIVYLNDDYSVAIKDYLKISLAGKQVKSEAFAKSDVDLKTQVTKINDFNPDVVVFIGYTPSVGEGVKNLRTLGYDGDILASWGFGSARISGPAEDYAKGVFYTEFTDVSNPTVSKKIILDKLTKKTDHKVGMLALVFYDYVYVLRDMIESADSLDNKEIMESFSKRSKINTPVSKLNKQGYDIYPGLELVEFD